MDNINTIFLFVFIFSILTSLRLVMKFISALLQPEKNIFGGRELIVYGLFLSYLITYIVKNI
jgi:hypothetical protein